MSDRLESMAILVEAVESGSLSAAANNLGMPLATVSRRVAQLEAHLGIQILMRSPKGLTLTEQGETYVSSCRRILEQVYDAERLAAGEYMTPKGVLSVSAPIVLGRLHILPILKAFMKAYPEVDIRFEQLDRPVSLIEEHFDVAIRIGELPDSSLRARRVGQVHMVVCASPQYFELQGRPLCPQELASHACITFKQLMSDDQWWFGDKHNQQAVKIKSRMVVNTAEAAIDAAVDGLGVTRLLSYQVANAVAAKELEIVLQDKQPNPLPVNLLYAGGNIPQKLRAFIDFTSPLLEQQLGNLAMERA